MFFNNNDNDDSTDENSSASDNTTRDDSIVSNSSNLYIDEPDEYDKYNMKKINGDEREYSFEKDGEIYAGRWIREIMNRKDDRIYLGTQSRNDEVDLNEVSVPIDRKILKHSGLFGETRSGKTVYMKNAMIQLANKGYGFTYIDPKENEDDGTMNSDAFNLIQKLPKHRYDDIVYVTPKEIDGYSYNINLLDTPNSVEKGTDGYETAVNQQAKVLLKILQSIEVSGYGWGARMANILDTLIKPMIRSDRNYTVGDLQYFIENPDKIEKFLEDYKNESDDDYDIEAIRTISEYEESDFESIFRRVRNIVTDKSVRNLVFGENTDIDFEDIVKNNKILIIDINKTTDTMKNIIMGYVTFMIYQAAMSVSSDEHILFCDEFDVILDNDLVPVVGILKRGTAQDFLLWFATQTPSTINTMDSYRDVNVKDEAKTNIGLLSTGNVAPDEARSIVDLYNTEPQMSDLTSDLLANPDKYHFYVQPPSTDKQTGYAGEISAFPPYPPRIGEEKALEIVKESFRENASPHKQYLTYEDSVRDYIVNSDENLNLGKGLEIVDVASIFDSERENSPEGYARLETIKQILKHTEFVDTEKIDVESWLERQVGRDRIETVTIGKTVYYKVTETGLDKIEFGTGEDASSGSDAHKIALQNLRKELAKYGIFVDLVSQTEGDGEIPDGIGYVFASRPDCPFRQNISVGDSFVIEMEFSTTKDKPYRMLTNLRKGYKDDDFVLFVTQPMNPDQMSGEETYEKIESIFDRGFCRKITSDGKRLYNGDTMVTEDKLYPLRKLPDPSQSATGRNKWYVSTDESRLKLMEKRESGSLKSIADWSPVSSFADWSVEDFPAYAEPYDDQYVIHDVELDEEVGVFSDVQETDKYRLVKEPWVSSVEFEDDIPDRDDVGILVMPTKGRQLSEYKVYYEGEFYEMGESPQNQANTSDDKQDETDSEDVEPFFETSEDIDEEQSDNQTIPVEDRGEDRDMSDDEEQAVEGIKSEGELPDGEGTTEDSLEEKDSEETEESDDEDDKIDIF